MLPTTHLGHTQVTGLTTARGIETVLSEFSLEIRKCSDIDCPIRKNTDFP